MLSFAGSGLEPQDDSSSRTLYLRFSVDPESDGLSDFAARYEAGWVFLENGKEHLGLGNAMQAWGYSAFNAVQPDTKHHGKGEVDFNSEHPETAGPNSFELPRMGVRRTFIARIDFLPGQDDRITVWTHPDLKAGLSEADMPESLTTRFRANASFDGFALVHRGGGTGWRIGDLAVATAFEDLTTPRFWQKPGFFGWMALGIAVLVGSAGWRRAVMTGRNLRRQREQVEAAHVLERERSRIARDLHDSLGATLSEISLLSSITESQAPPSIAPNLGRIQRRTHEAVEALEAIVWATDPKADTVGGFVDHALGFANDFLTAAGIRVNLSKTPATVAGSTTTMAAHLRHNAFLAFKEAVNNVVKHARAREVRIVFDHWGHQLVVEVSDDGRGDCRPIETLENDDSTGHGLRNMKARLESIGGSMRLESHPGQGTRIRFEIPLGETAWRPESPREGGLGACRVTRACPAPSMAPPVPTPCGSSRRAGPRDLANGPPS